MLFNPLWPAVSQMISNKRIILYHLFFLLFFSLFSSSEEEKQADVREEKPDLRLRHGFHHQCHAYRSQSDATEWHGVK